MKRLKIVSVILAVLLLTSSCKFMSFDMNTLLTPPLMNSDNLQINKAITDVAGGVYEPVYPQKGNYKSSVISVKLTEDVSSTICFYSSGSNKEVSFIILDNIDGKWTRSGMLKSKASGVERVDFCDLDGDSRKEIVIGWKYLSGDEYGVEVFSVNSENEIVSRYTGMYNEFITFDDAVVVISKNIALKTASATLIGNTEGGIGVVNTVSLNNSIAGFVKIQTGKSEFSGSKTDVIFIDEQLDSNTYVTELLLLGGAGAKTLSVTSQSTQTLRLNAHTCKDVDGDGLPDIPIERTLPMYYRNGTEERLSYVDWHSCKSGELTYIMSAYSSVNEPFYIELPQEWIGKITIKRDEVYDRTVHFFALDGENEVPMFSIRVFSHQGFHSSSQNSEWLEIASAGENVYTYKNAGSKLPKAFSTTLDMIKENLKVIA